MKTKKNQLQTLVAGLLMVVLAACGSTSNDAAEAMKDVVVTYSTEAAADGAEKYLATMSIDGMSCEMMCGSKISSTLANVPGVTNTEIDFNGMEEENFAVVEFDATKTSEAEFVEAVQGLANGAYKVKTVEVKHYVAGEAEAEESDEMSLNAPKLRYELPNVFSAIAALF